MASDTKERILEAARELFAQKGVQKTSLQEIADKLGITKPALYYHFASREDLVRSIVQPLIDDGEKFLTGCLLALLGALAALALRLVRLAAGHTASTPASSASPRQRAARAPPQPLFLSLCVIRL